MSGTTAAVLYHISKFQLKVPEVELQSRSVLCWSFDNNDANKGDLYKVPHKLSLMKISREIHNHKIYPAIKCSS